MDSKRPELLAPAGDWACLKAAVENGADAVYFGLNRFNARMRAENFGTEQLPEIMAYLHRRGVKGYVTFNTLIFSHELAAAEQYLRAIITAGVDAVIVQDIGLCRLIRQLSPDFPLHGSTQMTVTSTAGVKFVRELGCQVVVLARECSIKEISRIMPEVDNFPLEIFVHGALCVAYSGQCLTSEALGGRSANRGECAQACRMPYHLIVDGQEVALGDQNYLLSPQDLAGLELLPELVDLGLASFKIEGRLKSPEYVANITKVYRQALDAALGLRNTPDPAQDRYDLEMGFSRGLYTGWLAGIDHQALVHARFGKKRGVYLGHILEVTRQQVRIHLEAPLQAGDGVVFDCGHPDQDEEGGSVYGVHAQGSEAWLEFGHGHLDFRRIRVGDRLWKTKDPALERRVRQTFAGEAPRFQRPLMLEVYGAVGEFLTVVARDEHGYQVRVRSAMPLVTADLQPLTSERLREQLGRLGGTAFKLGTLSNHLIAEVMIPLKELNRLRRAYVLQLDELRAKPLPWQLRAEPLPELTFLSTPTNPDAPNLIVLVRSPEQLKAALQLASITLYCELEDIRSYREAVNLAHRCGKLLYVAPPRITKPGEESLLRQVRASQADGYLIRNYDQLSFFDGEYCIGDFSLNVTNPLTAAYLKERFNLERLTASYDLDIQQLTDLLTATPPAWFEVTIHQHMPMFHMEHCVFCAFLSTGTDYTNCGRPCEHHQVKLRDRVGSEHVLKADAGCRNTVFNGRAQTAAEYVERLRKLGLADFRIEFVHETPQQMQDIISRYQQLLNGQISGSQLWRDLQLQPQLGVTRGSQRG